MNKDILVNMKVAAENAIRQEDEYAQKVEEVINTRQGNVTMPQLIAQIAVTTLLLIGGSFFAVYFSGVLADDAYIVGTIQVLPLSAIIITIVFSAIMIVRHVTTMKYYKYIFIARSEVNQIREQLSARLSEMEVAFTRMLESRSTGWNLPVTQQKNVEEWLHRIEKAVVDKEELRTDIMNKAIMGLFYLGLTIWGLYACSASYDQLEALTGALARSFGDMLNFDLTGLVDAVVWCAMGIGLGVQYWIAGLFLKVNANVVPYWAVLCFTTGLVCVWATAFMIYALICIICLMIALVIAVVQIVIAIIGALVALVVIIGVIAGFFGG